MSLTSHTEFPAMIRLLFLAQLPPPVHGASLMSRYLLDDLLKAPNYQVVPMSISTANSLSGLGKPTAGKLLRLFWLVLQLFTCLLRKRFDVAYITLTPTGPAFIKDSLLLALAKLFVPRRVIHLHGKGIQAELSRSALHRWAYRFVFSGCEVVHLSHCLLRDIEGLPCTARHIVANGGPAQPPISPTQKKYDFIYLSNLIESKGIFDFLEALGQLKAHRVPFRAAVVGSAATEHVTNRVTELLNKHQLHSDVDFLGPRYGEEKYSVLAASRIFVLPTLKDCFPLSILEAMSVGLPVVSTDEGAIAEIVEHKKSGLIVERGSPSSLSYALLQLLRDPEQVLSMSIIAKERFERNYSLDAFCFAMQQLLSQTVSSSTAG